MIRRTRCDEMSREMPSSSPVVVDVVAALGRIVSASRVLFHLLLSVYVFRANLERSCGRSPRYLASPNPAFCAPSSLAIPERERERGNVRLGTRQSR